MARKPIPRENYNKEIAQLMSLSTVISVDNKHSQEWINETLDAIRTLSNLLLNSEVANGNTAKKR